MEEKKEEEDTSSTTDEDTSTMDGGRRRKQKTKKSRKTNNALKEWVKFVKKVRAEEKIDSYKKAMSRAKVRADKGEKWRSMKGGEGEMNEGDMDKAGGMIVLGGRRRKSRGRSRGRSRHRTMRRSRRRSSRRH